MDIVSAPAEAGAPPAMAASIAADKSAAPEETAPAPANVVAASTDILPAPAATLTSGIQIIAAAYGDYTKKSLQDTQCFVEKLAGARSFGKAVQVQAEYARATYETFVTESRKIRGLYNDLARQSLKPREDPAA